MKEFIRRIINEILRFCLNNKILSKLVLGIYYLFIKIGLFLKKQVIVEENIDYSKILEEYSPKPKEKTYYGENRIVSEEYDLQVIVPAYNVEAYIEECLNSILNQQTKYKILIIVINDGSTDNTGEILKKYQNIDNIKIINQKNQGISEARNRGLEEIRAKYIMFVDSDDILLPNSIEKMLNRGFEDNLDIVEGSFKRYYLGKVFEGSKHNFVKKSDSIKTGLFGFPWGKIIKSNIFERLKFPLKYNYEDSIFAWLIYPKKYSVGLLDEEVYLYRVNQKSISYYLKENRRSIETFYIMEEMIKNGLNFYNINIDKNLYLNFLGQVRLNYNRTINCPEKIRKAIFYKTKFLLENYFSELDIPKNFIDKELVKSLKNNNYGKYKFICRFGRKLL